MAGWAVGEPSGGVRRTGSDGDATNGSGVGLACGRGAAEGLLPAVEDQLRKPRRVPHGQEPNALRHRPDVPRRERPDPALGLDALGAVAVAAEEERQGAALAALRPH
eukprot:EG_transcript_29692